MFRSKLGLRCPGLVCVRPQADAGHGRCRPPWGPVAVVMPPTCWGPRGGCLCLASGGWRLNSVALLFPPLSKAPSSERPSAKTVSELSPPWAWHTIPVSLTGGRGGGSHDGTQVLALATVSCLRPAALWGFRLRIHSSSEILFCLFRSRSPLRKQSRHESGQF